MRSARRHPWVSFILRRLFALLVVLMGLVVTTFLMIRLIPGDPAANILGLSATSDQIEAVRHDLGIDRPVPEQFVVYIERLAQGDLGRSFFQKEPVTRLISQRIGTSLQLALLGLALVLVVSVPLGMIVGAFTQSTRRRGAELGFTAATSVLGAMPEFLTATFLALIFAVWLRLLPVASSDTLAGLVLPAASVCIRPIAVLTRIVRVETLNVLALDYIRTARGKRLPARLIYLRHVLPNVVTAALTVGGLLFAGLIGGAVVVENVFARAGLGTALVAAVIQRDYPLVQGIILVLGATVVIVNTAVDLLVAVADPRAVTRSV